MISDYTTKLPSSKQYGTGTKTDIDRWHREPRNEATFMWAINL